MYHLIHLPGTGRTLTLTIGTSAQSLSFRYGADAHTILTIPTIPLSDVARQRVAWVLVDYAARTEGFIELPQSNKTSNSHLEARIVNNNEFVAENLAQLVLTQGLGLPDDVDVTLRKNYENHNSFFKVVAALTRLRTRSLGFVRVTHRQSGRMVQFSYEDEIATFLMELQLDSLDVSERQRARAWFVSKGFHLWEHDRGACLQMMEPENIPLPVLQLRFSPDPDAGARYVLDVFMRVFDLPLDVALSVDEP
jgi:hypothetical protein